MIMDRFEMSMMEVLTFFLGFQIKQAKEGTFISQMKYTHDILKKFGMDKAKSIKTPMGTNDHLDLDLGCTSVDQKVYRYLCNILSILYDSNGSKLYIYICFVFQNLSMCLTYIYYIGSMPKSVEYQFFVQFLKFPELPRQFSSDMFGLWPEHIQLVGHVQLLTQTCLSLRFPTYIRGLSPPPPLRTLGFFFSSTPSLATTNGSLGNFGSSPLNPFSF
jgi:hypothetical protein